MTFFGKAKSVIHRQMGAARAAIVRIKLVVMPMVTKSKSALAAPQTASAARRWFAMAQRAALALASRPGASEGWER